MARNSHGLVITLIALCIAVFSAAEPPKPEPIIGMYIHQHWPFNRP